MSFDSGAEAARRAQEASQRMAEEGRRAAEIAHRAAEESARRADETSRRMGEEAARRGAEMSQRAGEESLHRVGHTSRATSGVAPSPSPPSAGGRIGFALVGLVCAGLGLGAGAIVIALAREALDNTSYRNLPLAAIALGLVVLCVLFLRGAIRTLRRASAG